MPTETGVKLRLQPEETIPVVDRVTPRFRNVVALE
jgi:hypothetical protein